MKNIKLILLFLILHSIKLFSQATLEFTAGAGNPTGNGPTIANQVITLQKNTNNPSGNTFVAFTPTTTATFSLTNQVRTMTPSPKVGVIFGATNNLTANTLNSFELFPLMNAIGGPSNANFTSANSTAGTGIDTTVNRNIGVYVSTYPLLEASAPLPSTTSVKYQFADLVITFNNPVTNPIIHIVGAGAGTPGVGGSQLLPSAEFQLMDAGLSLTRLSGSSEFTVPTSTTIINGASQYSATTGSGGMSGSVQVNGQNLTSVTLRIFLSGQDNTSVAGQPIDWNSGKGVNHQTGDFFTIGLSESACNAGTFAPQLSTSNVCDSNIVNLNSYHTGTTPTSSSLVWFTNNLHSGAAYATPTTATTGTYYAFYYDSTNSCYSPASNSLDVTINDCLDSDGDGYSDWQDLDDDNDGILDTVENGACGIPSPNIAPGNGVITRTIFNENFGTMNTSYGTTSITLAGLGTGATTTYNYYQAIAGTTPTDWNDGSAPPYSLDDGRYSVFNNIQQTAVWAGGDWQTIGDHTNGGTTPTGGRMLIVNASYSPGEFYRRTLSNVVQGSPINVSLWVMNMVVYNGLIDPNITVRFEQPAGNVVYSFDTGDISYNSQGDVNAWKFFKNPTPFFPPTSQPIDVVLVNNAPGGSGNDLAIDDIIVYQSLCDTDNDGIPNYLDLDSDGDGCSDAIEGGAAFTSSNLQNSSMPGGNSGGSYTGTSSLPVIQNLGNTVGNTATTMGVPTIAGTGQSIGDSQNGAVSSQCLVTACYKPAVLDAGNTYPTKHGITSLGRAGADNGNWPMVRQSAWTALEAKTKGFVVNRVRFNASNQPVADDGTILVITSPVEGMMVYDITNNCLKVYTSNNGGSTFAWHCMSTQACPQ